MGDPVKTRFLELQQEYPNHSSYIHFVRLIRELGVTNQAAIGRYFNKFVDKEDYAPQDKRRVINAVCKSVVVKPPFGGRFTKNHAGRTKHPVPSPITLFI